MIYSSPPTVALEWPSAFTVNVLFPKQMPALKLSLRRVLRRGPSIKGDCMTEWRSQPPQDAANPSTTREGLLIVPALQALT
jgi:hypothetical protein